MGLRMLVVQCSMLVAVFLCNNTEAVGNCCQSTGTVRKLSGIKRCGFYQSM